jgi:hypothetical protein
MKLFNQASIMGQDQTTTRWNADQRKEMGMDRAYLTEIK